MGKSFFLEKKDEFFIWQADPDFFPVVDFTRKVFLKIQNSLREIDVLASDFRNLLFVSEKPKTAPIGILHRKFARVIVSEKQPIKLVVPSIKSKFPDLSFFVYDISIGGIGLLFNEQSTLFKPTKILDLKLQFFHSNTTIIPSQEINFKGKVVQNKQIDDNLYKVGIKFLDITPQKNLLGYKTIFSYVLMRQRQIRDSLKALREKLYEEKN